MYKLMYYIKSGGLTHGDVLLSVCSFVCLSPGWRACWPHWPWVSQLLTPHEKLNPHEVYARSRRGLTRGTHKRAILVTKRDPLTYCTQHSNADALYWYSNSVPPFVTFWHCIETA